MIKVEDSPIENVAGSGRKRERARAEEESGWLDFTGACLSWACALHCLALPLLVGVLPLVGLRFLLDETVEWLFVAVSILIGAASFLPAYFRRRNKIRAVALFLAGIGLIAGAHLLFEDDFLAQTLFIVTGAVLITIAHIVNRRLCRRCSVCQTAAE